jgi:hypothetical protein
LLSSTALENIRIESSMKEDFLFLLCYLILYRDLGFQSKGLDLFWPFAFLAGPAASSWHYQKTCIYCPEQMEASRTPQR